MNRRTCWVKVGLVLAAMTLNVAAGPVLEKALGPSGEIMSWLELGDIPIPAGSNTWAATMDRDLLAPVGGEAAVKPAGAQEVKLPEGVFIWKLAHTRTPEYCGRPGWGPLARLPLCVETDGRAVSNAVVYLYCRLLATEAVAADFLLGSDDGVKILLNGTELRRFAKQRSALNDTEQIHLLLRAGVNELLVRVDNYVSTGGFVGRLIATNGAALTGVKVQLPADAKTPAKELPPEPAGKAWAEVVAEIPPVPPAPQEEFFGGRLTRTMSLLQDGAMTRRPVRIVFYGQSITDQEWSFMLVERLRERYPGTTIEMENHALGGWFVWRLMRAMVHGVLQSRPDLVVFHAYQGSSDNWERVLAAIRRETCAEIMIRSAHISRYKDDPGPDDDGEVKMLRRLAQKYDCEMVEARREWLNYLRTHKLEAMALLRDGVHLNRKGNVLMTQLYERHFRWNTLGRSWWVDRVQWYEALRPLSDHVTSEIRCAGAGWNVGNRNMPDKWLESSSTNDALALKFSGRRVDIVLGPRPGGVRVLIDGQPPSALNLYFGTLPKARVSAMSAGLPGIMRYFTGPDMREEVWEMRFTHLGGEGNRFRYGLYGSVTGFDGEGTSEADFVSRSGRIRLYLEDMERVAPAPEKAAQLPLPPAVEGEKVMTWRILPRFRDTIRWTPPAVSTPNVTEWCHITVADGLADGPHEITLVPLGDGPVAVRGIEVFRPPLSNP